MRWSVSLSLLFGELPFLERFAAAAGAGFEAVEFMWPRELGDDLDPLVRAREAAGVQVALFNVDAGDIAAGDRGFASHPQRKEWWRQRARLGLDLAGALEAQRINLLVGNQVTGTSRAAMLACLLDNLDWLAAQAEPRGVTLLVEPLNRHENPSYLLSSIEAAVGLLEILDSPAIRLQFDVYHASRSGIDVVAALRRAAGTLAHVQIADSPGRHQPGTGSVPWPEVFAALEEAGYDGYVGLEYVPDGSTEASLAWLPRGKRAASAAAELRL